MRQHHTQTSADRQYRGLVGTHQRIRIQEPLSDGGHSHKIQGAELLELAEFRGKPRKVPKMASDMELLERSQLANLQGNYDVSRVTAQTGDGACRRLNAFCISFAGWEPPAGEL